MFSKGLQSPFYLKLIAFQFGELKFADTIDLKVTFYLDLHKMRADGKLHNLTIHLNIKYNGTPDACSSLSASREFIYDKLVAASIKYYVPRKFKHLPLEVTRCMRIPEKCRRTVFWEWGLQEDSLWILSKAEYISDPNFVFPCRISNLNKSINPRTKGLKKKNIPFGVKQTSIHCTNYEGVPLFILACLHLLIISHLFHSILHFMLHF